MTRRQSSGGSPPHRGQTNHAPKPGSVRREAIARFSDNEGDVIEQTEIAPKR
jgi:hypothetical protein